MKCLSLLFVEEWSADTLSCNGPIVYWACYIEDGRAGFLKLKLNMWLYVKKKSLINRNLRSPVFIIHLCLGWISSRSLCLQSSPASLLQLCLIFRTTHGLMLSSKIRSPVFRSAFVSDWHSSHHTKPNVRHRPLKNDSFDKQLLWGLYHTSLHVRRYVSPYIPISC